MAYVARLKAPSTDNRYWIKSTKGGLNECIIIEGNSCLPNCVGYAWGRWYELLKERPKLSKGNAENWYNYKDGYKRGSTPKLGAVICWRKGKAGNANDGAGHVAVVEKINDDGSIVVSESSFGGSRFKTRKLSKTFYLGKSYTFQGFIYLPVEEVEEEKKEEPEKKTTHEVALEVIRGKYGNGSERRKKLTAAGYNYTTVQAEVNRILWARKKK